jgi:hypothetical protein
MFDAAFAGMEAARAQSRVEIAASDARVARLKHAAELERIGRHEEAEPIIAAVRAEQESLAAVERLR